MRAEQRSRSLCKMRICSEVFIPGLQQVFAPRFLRRRARYLRSLNMLREQTSLLRNRAILSIRGKFSRGTQLLREQASLLRNRAILPIRGKLSRGTQLLREQTSLLRNRAILPIRGKLSRGTQLLSVCVPCFLRRLRDITFESEKSTEASTLFAPSSERHHVRNRSYHIQLEPLPRRRRNSIFNLSPCRDGGGIPASAVIQKKGV
ncbi:hypothetical protein KP509_06G019700 [Ceratopteris richardii]|uniref:Uncharacterized protein n=1 Tax=Ceratopteris richardii TaxID=49495 RepID=A0A8T2UM99_CERRI|nr:hypothetical protein KP509_06G019700 [Ceratopteris richardii]